MSWSNSSMVQRRDLSPRVTWGVSCRVRTQTQVGPRSSLGRSLVTRSWGRWPISWGRGLMGARKALPERRARSQMAPFPLSLCPPLLAPEETSAAEGTTRPSRGQCDAGHVIPPAVPVSSISFVTSHSVDRELGADSSTPAVTAVTTGVGEPHSGKKVLSPRPFLLPTRCPRPWSLYSHPSYGQTILARWGLGTVSPAAPCSREGSLPLRPICFVFHVTAV